jgi:hypothetical protein
MFYYNNQTGPGDEIEGSEREGLEMDGLEVERLEGEDVKRLYSLYLRNI